LGCGFFYGNQKTNLNPSAITPILLITCQLRYGKDVMIMKNLWTKILQRRADTCAVAYIVSIGSCRDRKKVPAPDLAIFEPCGADLFLSSKKIDHVAQFVELPFQGLAKRPDSIPNLLIMNLQVSEADPYKYSSLVPLSSMQSVSDT
jgi:hypothetical protein